MTGNPKLVMLEALRGRRIGEHVSVNTFHKEFDAAGLTPKQRAQFGALTRSYCSNTGWTEVAVHGPSKGRRVCIYRVEKRPTERDVKAAS